jgi:hypothetical protein
MRWASRGRRLGCGQISPLFGERMQRLDEGSSEKAALKKLAGELGWR